ncbi:porin [Pseudoalteromonas ulvae]|uniref:Porin n=1 Tax=Pseudoalteromonas ulvae TaxID=107327 RepID=A0A244CMQ3_PSEDV|nr:porin [Pseudoalteromonas ulvae]OUL56911.1 porin [Pseudoalteromonas ulvae]
MCKFKYLIVFCVYLNPLCLAFANDTSAQDDIAVLKSQIAALQAAITALEKKVSKQATNLETTTSVTAAAPSVTDEQNDHTVRAYATVRPTFGYIDSQGQSEFDVRDALSHAGIKATKQFNTDWQAILHGEWGIDLANQGNFGKSRQVYVALDSPYGRIGIGKQRPTQYLFIAEYVDIFNHSSSPFAYDPESLFFVDNLITYQITKHNLTWMAVAQFNGQQGDAYSDLFNAGVSYDHNGLHSALTYQQQDVYDNQTELGEDEIFAASLAYEFSSGLYLALSYQDKQYQRLNQNDDRNGHTLDISSAFPIGHHHKIKLGYFDFSSGFEGEHNQDYNGHNITLEWLPTESLRLHLEYLAKDFDAQENFYSWSVGFRYDYSQQWSY